MYRKLITKRFFAENPIKEFSAQRLVYSYMFYDGFEEMAVDYLKLDETKVLEEQKQITGEENSEVLIKMMRGKTSTLNRGVLYGKLLEKEEMVMPQIIDMLKRSLNNEFIENAAKLLVKCEKNYSSELFEIMNDVRSEYAQSLICLVLGFKANEDVIPWLYSKYNYFKNNYKNENYDQGPLIALVELNARFYVNSK